MNINLPYILFFLQGDKLMVPWNVHKQVALLVVEAYQKFILGRNLGSLIMEGVKQVCSEKEFSPARL